MPFLCPQRPGATSRGTQNGQTLHGGGRIDRGGTGRCPGRLSQIGSSRRANATCHPTNDAPQTCERGCEPWDSINRLEPSIWLRGLKGGGVRSIPNNGDTSRGSCEFHTDPVPGL